MSLSLRREECSLRSGSSYDSSEGEGLSPVVDSSPVPMYEGQGGKRDSGVSPAIEKGAVTTVDGETSISANTCQRENDNLAHQRPSLFVVQVTAIASLGGILFGYDLGVIADALPQLTATFDLSNRQQGLIVSVLYAGGGLGAAVGGSLCDVYGRKRAILWTDAFFLLGAILLTMAPNPETVVAGRIVVGFAVAVSGIADVSYLNEIAPIQWRGSIVSVNEASIALGFLLAFWVGSAFGENNNDNANGGWRIMFGLSGGVAMVQFLGMWYMPESPKWLREQGRLEESEAALRRINGEGRRMKGGDGLFHHHPQHYHAPPEQPEECQQKPESDCELSVLDNSNSSRSLSAVSTEGVESPVLASADSTTEGDHHSPGLSPSIPSGSSHHHQYHFSSSPVRCCLYWPSRFFDLLKAFGVQTLQLYRRQTFIALFLATAQQLCGQTNVISYAPAIFAASADDYTGREWATLSIGLVKFVMTVLVIWKIEVIGRRFLLLLGMGTIAFGLLLITFAFSVGGKVGSEENSGGGVFWLTLPGVLLVVCGYSMSFGPLTWLLTSELFPTDIRGRCLGGTTIVTNMCAALVTYTFLPAQDALGTSSVFALYLFVTVVGWIFALYAIPDTAGKTAEEIDGDLSNMPWWQRHERRRSWHAWTFYGTTPDTQIT